jgi:hypothetical protein
VFADPATAPNGDVVKYCRVPSPIGHAVAGIAAGFAIRGSGLGTRGSGLWSAVALFAAAGMAPALDLLVVAHSGPTHGVGAAVLVGCVALAVAPRFETRDSGLGTRLRFAVAVAAAYSTHILLDWLGTDTSTPIGIMALWPFSHAYYESSAHVFMAISRRYWLPEFWTANLIAVGRELLILGPVVAMVMWRRRPRVSEREVSS